MSLFSAIDRAAQSAMDVVYGDPMRLTPRRRPRDVNAGWEADPDRSVAEFTGIYTHLAVDSNIEDAKDRYADHRPGTSQANHLIDVNDPVDTNGNPIAFSVGDRIVVLAGDGVGTWQITTSSPNDVGGVLLSVNKV